MLGPKADSAGPGELKCLLGVLGDTAHALQRQPQPMVAVVEGEGGHPVEGGVPSLSCILHSEWRGGLDAQSVLFQGQK
jgi:hypothetical protein